MPILNYLCEDCGKEFAKIFVDVENAPKQCPVCKSDRLVERGDAFRADPGLFTRLTSESCDTCDSCFTCGENVRSALGSS
ncbi:MAG: FmdB family zinc ribbon protein [Desulfomonilaceae bacterium]